jgi:adenosylmethionine-8-amino-7-oxononanoate aminotransferase
VNFIAHESSYHSNTIGTLGISGYIARRVPYEPFLMDNIYRISACYIYQQCMDSESDEFFVTWKATKLEAKFQELGLEIVIRFVCEFVIGAALGYIPSVPGYLKAMRDVYYKHNALFILDKMISSIRRCGTLHA